jgi:hypothetical protein
MRWLLAAAFVLVFLFFLVAGPAEARQTYNPYKGFNLSGINYASQQWARQHRSSGQRTSGGRVYWRL